ncbi:MULTISPECIES: hypothetical protein [Parachlamydia]|jgi:hypothetical protein|uniref:hypothetical protein n=1 Tax=Parachlamydia TaxID=83551 RepID=UPI0001C17441|nr:hypothetical protein [Parachlamydia acanthamoebae]EFB40879.1 hypothetical protein pah_c180o071 [Parachlamydia acanthamoebae str. Hall's coccus]
MPYTDLRKRDLNDHVDVHDHEVANGSPLVDENGNPYLHDPIEVYLEKLGEQLRRELADGNPNDERLLNLALSVLMFMFRKSARFDNQYCQDTLLEIKYQGIKIRDTIDNWKRIAPSVASAVLTIGSGAVGLAPVAGGAFQAVKIIGDSGKIFNFLTAAGTVATPLGAFGQGIGALQGVANTPSDAKKVILELDLDKMKNKLSDRTQTSVEKTQKCGEIARKVYELYAQLFAIKGQMAGAQS